MRTAFGLYMAYRSIIRFPSLYPASFFEKKQAIDNATKVAIFGPLYWAHLRLGRLNGRNFIASGADFGGNLFAWHRRVASSTFGPPRRMADWNPSPRCSATHKLVIYMTTFSRRISPFFPEFRHFLVSARGKLGLDHRCSESAICDVKVAWIWTALYSLCRIPAGHTNRALAQPFSNEAFISGSERLW